MKASEYCQQAAAYLDGDRANQHGDMDINFSNIAQLWNAFLTNRRHRNEPLSPRDVAIMMALMKIARMETGSLNHDDTVDSIGYLAIAGHLEFID